MSKFPQLSLAGLTDYEPYEGGGHGLVPQEGLYGGKITAATPDLAKDGTKGLVVVNVSVQDQDALNIPLIGRAIYSGVDRNGKSLNRQYADLLVASGTPVETIKGLAASGQAWPIESMAAQLVGKEVYFEVKFEAYNGEIRSQIANWIPKSRYLKAKENNGLRGRKIDQVNINQLVQAQAQGTAMGAPGQQAFGGGQPNLGGQPQFAQGFQQPQGAPNMGGQPMGQVMNSNAQASSIPNL